MANSKIQLSDGTTLIDLTGDTVTAAALLSGVTAHGADGNAVTGSYVPKFAVGITNELTAKASSLTVRGIADSAGRAFTPTGCALVLKDSSATTHTYAEDGMAAIIHASESESDCTRITLYGYQNNANAVNRVRTNPAAAGFTFGNGTVTYSTGNPVYALLPGRYLWVAWADEPGPGVNGRTAGLLAEAQSVGVPAELAGDGDAPEGTEDPGTEI